jgi:excisionase family DNA binding protein
LNTPAQLPVLAGDGVLNTPLLSIPGTTVKTILNAKELSKFLPLHPETIRKWAREGHIPHRRLGRKVVFLSSEIDAWIASGTLFTSVMPPQPESEAA